MINSINDIRKALDSKSYRSALALALTLPSICSKIEYGDDSRENYKNWCDRHIPKSMFRVGISGFEKNELDGEIIYQLRCSVLHSGNSDIDKKYGIGIDTFSLWVNESSYNNYGYEYQQKSDNGNRIYNTKIDLVYLVETLCDSAEGFYNGWSDKAAFDNHKLNLEIR